MREYIFALSKFESVRVSVKTHWIIVNTAPLKKFRGAILTEVLLIFSESERLSLIRIESVYEVLRGLEGVWGDIEGS